MFISSPDILQFAAKVLKGNSQLPDRVLKLRIGGHKSRLSNQSWISSLPLVLPRLTKLQRLILCDIDLDQQHPEFPRLLSLLAPLTAVSESGGTTRKAAGSLRLYVQPVHQLEHAPARYASIARALHADMVLEAGKFHVQMENSWHVERWPHNLTSRMRVLLRAGEPQELDLMLRNWQAPLRHLSVDLEDAPLDPDLDPSDMFMGRRPHRVFREIGRISWSLVRLGVQEKVQTVKVNVAVRWPMEVTKNTVQVEFYRELGTSVSYA